MRDIEGQHGCRFASEIFYWNFSSKSKCLKKNGIGGGKNQLMLDKSLILYVDNCILFIYEPIGHTVCSLTLIHA